MDCGIMVFISHTLLFSFWLFLLFCGLSTDTDGIYVVGWLIVGLVHLLGALSRDKNLTTSTDHRVFEDISCAESNMTIDGSDPDYDKQFESCEDDNVIENEPTTGSNCTSTVGVKSIAFTSRTNATSYCVYQTYNMINNGGSFYGSQGPSCTTNRILEPSVLSDDRQSISSDDREVDQFLDDEPLADHTSEVIKLVEDVSRDRASRATLRFALLLAHSDYGLSEELLYAANSIICEGLNALEQLYSINSVSDLICQLQDRKIVKGHTIICLDSSDHQLIHSDSLNVSDEDRQQVSVTFCNVLLHVLEVRRPSVCSLHREAVLLTQRYLGKRNRLKTVKESELHVSLGKRTGKVGALKDAFNYIDKGIAGYKRCLEAECEVSHCEIKQRLVDALIAKGKMARRRGGCYLHKSLKYLKEAMSVQTELDGLSKYKARITVAECETYLAMGQYDKIVSLLQNESVAGAVKSDNPYHQAQYFANLGCALDFLGYHDEANELLFEADGVCVHDQCNYRKPLYLSLRTRVLVHLWHNTNNQSHLQEAVSLCCKAREMLCDDHGETHRFFALNECCMAMVDFAMATTRFHTDPISKPLTDAICKRMMESALSHATAALRVYLQVYSDTGHHPNIVSTLKLVGDMCVHIGTCLIQGMFDESRCHLKKLCRMFMNEHEHQLLHQTLSDSVQYAHHFYKRASTMLKQYDCDGQHPMHLEIEAAMNSLHN